MSQYVATPRACPDLDGLACAVAYAELLQRRGLAARSWIAASPDPEALHVAERLAVDIDSAAPAPDSHIVLVDASDLRGLPESVDAQRVVEVIDHRLHHRAAELFPNATLCIEPVGAAATLIAERFWSCDLTPSDTAARLLQSAIFSNTQALRGSITTARDRAAVTALRAVAALAEDFVAQQFAARGRAILADLTGAIAAERKDFDHPDGPYILSQLELPGARHHLTDTAPLIAALGPRAMLNLVDVEVAESWLLVPDAGLRAWVTERAGLHFQENCAHCPGILLRKQLVARLEAGS